MATGDTLMALSSIAVAKAKPREKPYKLADGHGLYLLVTPQGGSVLAHELSLRGQGQDNGDGGFPANHSGGGP